MAKTLHVLEQRVSINEEQVSSMYDYFKEIKEAQVSHLQGSNGDLAFNPNLLNQNNQSQQQIRYGLDSMKDCAQ